MITIKGKHNQAIAFCGELEPTAMGQIQAVCGQETFANSKRGK